MTRRLAFAALAAILLASFAFAADGKPDFSGDWKMNAAKSDFGPMPPPEKVVMKVELKDPNLTVTQTQVGQMGEFTSESKYTTDGKECINKSPRGESKSTVVWEGKTLVFNTKREIQGMEITQLSKWTLSDDGKVLTSENTIKTPQGDFQTKLILDRQ